MTHGQERAVRELERIQAASQGDLELMSTPQCVKDRLAVSISLRIGLVETRPGGLALREREDFLLTVPPGFPFDYPTIITTDERFASIPHVIWSTWICLYQSKLEWNPADSMYGFFDRLRKWLWKAAMNDLDPMEGPLEPPHHVTSFSQVPFVIRTDAPVAAGVPWYGLVELERHPNRIELLEWHDLKGDIPQELRLAVAIILPEPLPMQFPKMGVDLFKELNKQSVTQKEIIRNLALAALFTEKGDPIHLIVGLPMRRAADGSPRIHVAVWSTSPDFAETLRNALPEGTDTDAIRTIRDDLSNTLYSIFEKTEIAWCRVLEDRPEIIVRRDKGTQLEWFAGKKILVLGCGALGSWVAEMLVRAGPQLLHVLDNGSVKPGVLARQNYLPEDIGSKKADALAKRLKAVAPRVTIAGHDAEAHGYLTAEHSGVRDYDVILDCTASSVFQMKMERDWHQFDSQTPPMVSFVTDAKAQRCLWVYVAENSTGGVWDAYLQLKSRLCSRGDREDFVAAFYSEKSAKDLFQPEPGCSVSAL